MHPDDHLILEDESGRVKLAGSLLDPSAFVTGSTLNSLLFKVLYRSYGVRKFFVMYV